MLNACFVLIVNLLRNLTQYVVAGKFFPGKRMDWYAQKNYRDFNTFLISQRRKASIYFEEFRYLDLDKHTVHAHIPSSGAVTLDMLQIMPKDFHPDAKDLSGYNQHIVFFLGRGMYYEQRFRELAILTQETGATVWCFNYPGINLSTGKMLNVRDAIDAGIGVMRHLFNVRKIHPDDVVMFGNCLGGSIIHYVNAYFVKEHAINIRRIDSNSAKSMKAGGEAILKFRNLAAITCISKPILCFTGWEMHGGKLYEQTDPYKIYMSRFNDGIFDGARLHEKVRKYKREIQDGERQDKCPDEFKLHRDRFDELAEVFVDPAQQAKVPEGINHYALLYQLRTKDGENVFKAIINPYLEASQEYCTGHPQRYRPKVTFL